jgi:DNA-binding NarL/FixJ family response regulator
VLRRLDRLRPCAGPANLTAREVEVLALLARGLSNREIGTRLFISANTAANHIRSILMKTGTANRTQAARYATEHELA